jgi:hypothetical protein
MNTVSDHQLKQVNWSTIVMFALGFWLSSSLILDLVVIPGLSAAGMMTQGGFASAGYLIFGIFNRIELLCAASVLTGFLVFRRHHSLTHSVEPWSTILSGVLLVIPLVYTYILTPQMSALGLQLSLFESTNTMPAAMISMHEGYWALETVKFLVGLTLLRWCYRDSCPLA